MRRKAQLLVLRGLYALCSWVDYVAYRPAVVKPTMPLPRWWNCQLARIAIRLDDRWDTDYWDGEAWTPDGLCDACHRRAAWLQIGGGWNDEPELWEEGEEPEYLDLHPVEVCFWCKPEFDFEARKDKVAIGRALARAGRESIAWRWRWQTDDEPDR